MPMQKYFISFLIAGLFVAGIALADHGQETGVSAVDPAEVVTATDLGVEDAGMLPTSRLYFLKEFGRGITRFFTFDSVKKAELELRFANEKVAEAKEVQEIQPDNEQAITKALENYQKAQGRLKVRLEALKETSQNPNIDRLLDQVAEKTVRHSKLMEEMALKVKDSALVQELVSSIQGNIEDSARSGASKDEPVKFVARLEKSLIDSNGGELKHLRSITLLDSMSEKATEAMKESLGKLREEFSDRFQGELKTILETKTAEDLSLALEKIPGNNARHSEILEEMQAKEVGKTADSLRKSAGKLREDVQGGEHIAQKAIEQMKHAQEKVMELEKKMVEIPAVPDVVRKSLVQAKEHLANATIAIQEEKFGEAYGQATSAEVMVRNGLRLLEESREGQGTDVNRKEELGKEVRELALKIQKYEELVMAKGFTLEQNPEIMKFLSDAKMHLGFAQDAFGKDDMVNTKLHVTHVKDFLRSLAKAIEQGPRVHEEPADQDELKEEVNVRSEVKPMDILRKVVPQSLTPTNQLKREEE